MRKIKSKKDTKHEEKRKQTILAIVFISLLVLSTAGYAFSSQKNDGDQSLEEQEYSGLSFVKQNDYWMTIIDNQQYAFNYMPNELTNISINITKQLSNYSNQPLYIVNPSTTSSKLISNLYPFILRYQEASLNQTEKDIHIKNCSTDNIIIFQENNYTQIYQEENCIYIEGNISEATDKLLYTLFEII